MEDVTAILKTFFTGIWHLFSGVTIPGLNMSAAQLLIALFVAGFSLRLISVVTGFGTNVGGAATSISKSHERINEYRRASRWRKDQTSLFD